MIEGFTDVDYFFLGWLIACLIGAAAVSVITRRK